MYFVNSHFYGTVCARLPFEPFGFVGSMTHRGLEGDDMQEVSLVFIYLLAQMILRGTVSKVLGTEGPRMPVEHQTPKWLQDYQK